MKKRESTLRRTANDYLTYMTATTGITLISLIITIIVLLILSGISISSLFGNNGVLNKVREAKIKSEEAIMKEQMELAIMEAMINADRDSIMNLSILETSLKNNLGQDITIEKSMNDNLPWVVTKNGYQFQVQATGKVVSLGKNDSKDESFEETDVDYFIWETTETEAKIIGLKPEARTLEVVSIPNIYQGLPVKSLSGYFAEYDSENNIDETNEVLKKFIIPANLEEIQADALSKCFKLETIEVSESNSKFKDIDGVLFSKDETQLIQFPCNKIQEEYQIPNTVEILGQNAFAYTKVPNIKLNSNLKGIRETNDSEGNILGAFDNSEFANNSKLIIQNNIVNSGVYRAIIYDFENSGLLNEIVVEEGSTIFSSNNGILYNKQGTILYKYPRYKTGTVFTIPDKVKIIYESSFERNKNLTTINCGSNLKAIKKIAFKDANKINTINFNDGITYLGRAAFYKSGSAILNIPNIPNTLTTIEDNCFYERTISPEKSKKSIEAVNPKGISSSVTGSVWPTKIRTDYNYKLLNNIVSDYVESDINTYDNPLEREIPITYIELDKTTYDMSMSGENVEITATINSNATEKINWSIEGGDGIILSTSGDGKTVTVTGHSWGYIDVTASNKDGTLTAKCRIGVPSVCGYNY